MKKKPLNLLLTGAIAAATFTSAKAAVTLTLDDAFVANDPDYTMTLTFEETNRANEVKVTFKASQQYETKLYQTSKDQCIYGSNRWFFGG